MAIDREKARAAGYTDEEIDAYESAQAQQPQGDQPPPPPPADANQGQAGGINMGEIGTTMLAAAGPFGLGVATAAAAPLAYRGGKMLVEGAKNLVKPGSRMNPIGGGGPRMPTMGGGTPTTVPVTAGPVAPAPVTVAPAPVTAAPAPTAAQPNMLQRGMDYASKMRDVAAQRVLPVAQQAGQMASRGLSAAAPALRVGGMAANAMYSGDLNTGDAAELERRRRMAPTITR